MGSGKVKEKNLDDSIIWNLSHANKEYYIPSEKVNF
jgi:hypothetical protein